MAPLVKWGHFLYAEVMNENYEGERRYMLLDCEECNTTHHGEYSHTNARSGLDVFSVEHECEHLDYLTEEVESLTECEKKRCKFCAPVTARSIGINLR